MSNTPPSTGGSAFPVPMIPCDRTGRHKEVTNRGMDLRDWFAGQAVNGILSQSPSGIFSRENWWEFAYTKHSMPGKVADQIADYAYTMADAMIARREKGGAK